MKTTAINLDLKLLAFMHAQNLAKTAVMFNAAVGATEDSGALELSPDFLRGLLAEWRAEFVKLRPGINQGSDAMVREFEKLVPAEDKR